MIRELQQYIFTELEKLRLPESPSNLYGPIAYTISLGGKRLRPVLVLLGCELVGGKKEDAIHPAIGVELFHNFTLLHDDIMDNAPLRRNKPTVHAKWNSNIAILSGDVLFTIASQQISKVAPKILADVLHVYYKVSVDVCEGQQLDMDFESLDNLEIKNYIEMIRLKTAVLLGASLQIGALCGNASKEIAEQLYEIGVELGLAFQLQDDLLDAFGNEESFGKQVGGDIISNKKTWLKLRALEKADPSQKAELSDWYGLKQFDPKEKVQAVKKIFSVLDIPNEANNLIHHYYTSALSKLENLSVTQSGKAGIMEFTESLKTRVN
jgi:geranylgeranyl diphosphate synthase, type II